MATIEVQGIDGVRKMLGRWQEPILSPRLQKATKAGATVFKGPARSEAAGVSKRLARSISVRRAKRERPATIVTFRPKVAFFRHWILGGTKDHGPRKFDRLAFIPNWNPYMKSAPPAGASQVRTRKVRGMSANPILERIAARLEGQAFAAAERELGE